MMNRCSMNSNIIHFLNQNSLFHKGVTSIRLTVYDNVYEYSDVANCYPFHSFKQLCSSNKADFGICKCKKSTFVIRSFQKCITDN